ncbi:MAG: winged helix-turn-helix transcriptional regulator [Anaerolineaceae bacterium]
MKSTREKILNTLLTKRQATINELSEAVGINGISVRHHLINLQAEGLITAEEQRHGVGRPRFVYRLTDKGMEKFPTNYLHLTDQLLEKMKAILPKEKLSEIFTSIGVTQAEENTSIDKNLPLEDQLKQLSDQLAGEGFYLSWKNLGDQTILYSDHCPYHHIGLSHPEICEIDHMLFNTALGREVGPDECILQGDPRCTYIIQN